ncbi:ABC transporter substrate-binding protein (plasmid) [Rhizobium sp. CB3060]|uniref:ABC transporter substrate-binding protein n=1 Tax=Rhizobium sp. CB3060 TaxID=3138255 RepID=UPI0021A380ED|nr:ABC transporter substrate-binding protein [Rhizobium tropici]UWU26194.1 ABC transporter substrate-binding protein [Rhizobium tropici]
MPGIRRTFIIGLAASLTSLVAPLASADEERTPAAYPKAIEHSLGEAIISKEPDRIAVLGSTDADIVLALGKVPVLVNRWVPEWTYGVGPWAESYLHGQRPLMITSREISLELVAASNPDLIVGSSTSLDATMYSKLGLLAPTTAAPKEYPDPYTTPWDVETLFVGKALNREAQAQELVERTRLMFEKVRADHPSWQGKSAATLINWNGQVLMYAFSDNRGRFLKDMGFDMPADLKALTGGKFFAPISEERFDLFAKLDLIVVLTSSKQAREFFERSQLFQQLDIVKKGHVVYTDDLGLTMAMSASTVLSIPYVLDTLDKRIEQAIGK